jgi:hypothetical protein
MKTKNLLLALLIASGSFVTIKAAPSLSLYNDNLKPITGYYKIYGGASVSDSFILKRDSTLSSVDFIALTEPGSTLESVDWEITSKPFGGQTFAKGIADNLGSVLVTKNDGLQSPFTYETSESFNLNTLLPKGTYYLQLGNAIDLANNVVSVNSNTQKDGPVAWGESTGKSVAFSEYQQNITLLKGGNAFDIKGFAGKFVIATPGAPAPPLTACLAFAAVLVLQALKSRKRA